MKAIIFDIDGTLIESNSVDAELYFSSIRDVLGPIKVRADFNDYEHVTDSGILAQLLDENGLSVDEGANAAIQANFVEGIRKHIEDIGPFPVFDGAAHFFESARKQRDCQVAIATGGWRASALLKLESAGFCVDDVPLATSDDSPSRVEIMQTALSKAGNGLNSVTYFGDAEWDQRACRDLGWNFVAVGPKLGGVESYAEVYM